MTTLTIALIALQSLVMLYMAVASLRLARQVEAAHRALRRHWMWICEAERLLETGALQRSSQRNLA